MAWRQASIKDVIEEIACETPHRVRVRFARADPAHLVDLNDLNILPRSLRALPFSEWRTTDWSSAMPAAGPFRLVPREGREDVELVRNETYWGAPEFPRVDRVVLRVVPEESARVAQLLAGDIDYAPSLELSSARTLEGREGVRVLRRPGWGYVYIGFNVADPDALARALAEREERCRARDPEAACVPAAEEVAALAREHPHPHLGDARVRRAIAHALDREALIAALLHGEGEVPASPILSPLPGHDPELEAHPHDLEEARRLLGEAGYRDEDGDGVIERGGEPLRFEVLVDGGRQLRRESLELMAADLARVGIVMTIRPVESSSFYPTIAQHRMDAWVARWRVPARVDMGEILHARACGRGGANFGLWSHAEADALVDEAKAISDAEAKAALMRRWERIFHDEQPYVPLFRTPLLAGVSTRVRGAESIISNDMLRGIETWWLSEEGSGNDEPRGVGTR